MNNAAMDAFFAARSTGQPTVERAAVKKILTVCGVKHSTVNTFAGLLDINFPMRLVSANLNRNEIRSTVNDLMRRPTKAGAYNAYEDALAAFPDTVGSLGVVYSWLGSIMVFHDLELCNNLGAFGVFVKIKDKQFFLERLTNLAAKIGPAADWV